jgi:hypothetical protein
VQNSPRIWIAVALAVALALLAMVASPHFAPAPAATLRRGTVELLEFLPRNPVRDGSVDYTDRVQDALDAAAGRTLVLAPFPVRVTPQDGANHCLLVAQPMTIVGLPGSALIENTGAVQLLRCENVDGLRLEGFTLRGIGGVGHGLAHGTLQVWRCRNVSLRGVCVEDSDADGIAIADSDDVRVSQCVVARASKAAIYLSRCSRAIVESNSVRDVAGHVAPNGEKVGTGILLLSNHDVVCANNVLVGGIGAGILCGAGANLGPPDGALITSNSIRGFANPENAQVACGVLLANTDPNQATRVVVEGNQIRDCGPHGILAENHDACVLRGNTIQASALSAIAIGHASHVLVADNALVDCNASNLAGQAGVYLHPTTSGVIVHGNSVLATDGRVLPVVLDNAPAGANQVAQ